MVHGQTDEQLDIVIEQISSHIQDIKSNPEEFGYTSEEIDTLYIGKPIHSYEYLASGTMQENDYLLYPIFSNQTLLYFALIHTDTQKVELTQSLVLELKNYIDSQKEIAIISDSVGCHIYEANSEQIITIYTYSKSFENRGTLQDNLWDKNLQTTFLSREKQISFSDTLSIQPYASTVPTATMSVSYYTQRPNNQLCWAASTAMIGNKLTGRTYTAANICELYLGRVANIAGTARDALNSLNEIYGISYTKYNTTTPPTLLQIYNNISKGYPMYALFDDNGYRHMAVIRGENATLSRIYFVTPDDGMLLIDSVYDSTLQKGVYRYTSVYLNATYTLVGYMSYY